MDAPTIYEVPLAMLREKLDVITMRKLGISVYPEPNLENWKAFLDKLKYPKIKSHYRPYWKYVELQDAYKSILESLYMQVQ